MSLKIFVIQKDFMKKKKGEGREERGNRPCPLSDLAL